MVVVDQTDPSCQLKAGVNVKQFPPVANALPLVTNCPNEHIVEMTKSIKATVIRIARKYDYLRHKKALI